MASLIDDLNPSLATRTLKDGQIQVTVTLPAGVLPQFIQFLEALTGPTLNQASESDPSLQ
jgi:hypothetical protein